jgi:hypothetical protein
MLLIFLGIEKKMTQHFFYTKMLKTKEKKKTEKHN